MEVRHAQLYDYPSYYDLVFGSDWKAEFDFLLGCFERFGGQVDRVFEPACGTGRLLFRLAKVGYEVHGIDLNPKAVVYCNDRMLRHDLPPAAVVADMTEYQLTPQADAAFNMINSFRHLVTAKQADSHFKAVAQSLRKGGLYILGLHLTPNDGRPTEEESWSARRGHLGVTTRLWPIDRDLENRSERFRMEYDINTPKRSFRIEDEIEFRTYTRDQMQSQISDFGGFEMMETYDFRYDLANPVQLDDESEDAVYVLRRR